MTVENPIEQILKTNDEAFLIVSANNDEGYDVELHGSVDEKSEEIVEFTGETIEEALSKLGNYIVERVEYAFGNAFWQDVEDEKKEEEEE